MQAKRKLNKLTKTDLVDLLSKVLDVEESCEPDRKSKTPKAMTMDEIAEKYIELHLLSTKTSQRTIRNLKWRVLPEFGERTPAEITKLEVREWFEKLTKNSGGYMANRVVALARAMVNFAIDLELYVGRNPFDRVKKNPERKRERFLSDSELKRLFKVLDQEPFPVQALFTLYILTGLRKRELRELRWDEVDFERKRLNVIHTKNDRPHILPLSEYALELFTLLKKLKRNNQVFPGFNTNSLIEVDKNWYRIRQLADIEDVRVHDLRRTCGSLMASSGESLLVIGSVLNHKSRQSTEVYARLQDDVVSGGRGEACLRNKDTLSGRLTSPMMR